MARKKDPKRNPNFDIDLAKFFPKQKEALALLDSGEVKFLLYGGALGGGKSYFLRWYAVRRLMVLFQVFKIKNAAVMIACEDYPALQDRQLSKIAFEFPPWLGKFYHQHSIYGRCYVLKKEWGAGVILFRNLDQVAKYQSAEFCGCYIDELTKNDYGVFTYLRTRCRWPGLADIECQIIGATNPGGPGHGWVKSLWIDKVYSAEWYINGANEDGTDIDYRGQFAFVQSKASDNPIIGADYHAGLSTLPEHLRRAFRDGDWGIFEGQVFQEFRQEIHSLQPDMEGNLPEVPAHASIYMTFDWGFGAPFSVGWWWVDNDGRIYRFAEWYGWNGTPNMGLRLTDTEIVQGVIEREAGLGLSDRTIIRYGGPDCFQKRPDYRGGGQGPSTAEVFQGAKLTLIPGDPSRHLKKRQFHERLRVPVDYPNTLPMMMIYPQCQQFKRTIPDLVVNPNDIEDVFTDCEDHIYDEACHIVMARPLKLVMPEKEVRVERDPHGDLKKFFSEPPPEKQTKGIPVFDQVAGY
jgi:hypothetical protein